MKNAYWKYKIDENGEIVGGTFETIIIVDSVMMDGVRAKTLEGKNAYLQIIGQFGYDIHKLRFPLMMKHGTKLKIIVKLENEKEK